MFNHTYYTIEPFYSINYIQLYSMFAIHINIYNYIPCLLSISIYIHISYIYYLR